MAVIKEFRCPDGHGDFESTLPLCPKCRKLSTRVFLTPPNIGTTGYNNINRILDDTLPRQNLSNYTNATGYPRPTFSNIYQNDSGFSAGWADPSNIESSFAELNRYLPRGANPIGTTGQKMDESGRTSTIDITALAASLPKGVSAKNDVAVGKGVAARSALAKMTEVAGRYNGK
jgi:hypothetical protein